MLGDLPPVGFVHTTNVDAARAFYVDVLGLELVDDSPAAVVVRSGPTTIRVTPVVSHTPLPYTVLGWAVTDIDATLAELTSRGVVTLQFENLRQDDKGIWTTPDGSKVAWFHDPDGNTLSITQH